MTYLKEIISEALNNDERAVCFLVLQCLRNLDKRYHLIIVLIE